MTAGDPSAAPTIGVDVGGTNVRVAVVGRGGELLTDEHRPTGGDLAGLVRRIAQLARPMVERTGSVAMGVGAAGLVDRHGTVHYAPNLPMLRRARLGPALADAVGVPVVVDNDANVAAWGECCHGAARGVDDALVITLGTGIGGGIVIGGRIHRGANGFAAEVGHWQLDPKGAMCACGERGHWEAAASGDALGRLARARAAEGRVPDVLARAGGDVAVVTSHHVADSARAGDDDALALLVEYAGEVAVGFVGLANILDPEIIVVSGGLVALGDLLLEPVRAAFAQHVEGAAFRPAIPVVAAELGTHAGVIGAAALARELVP